jgi:hypothetical protein
VNKKINLVFLVTICFSINLLLAQSPDNQIKDPKNLTRTNSIYAELYGFVGIINYGKAFKYKPQKFLTLNVGLSYFDAPIVLGETTLLIGKVHHYLEPGVGIIVWGGEDSEVKPSIRIGYRYQGKKGLLFKAGLFGPVDELFPVVGLGYSF